MSNYSSKQNSEVELLEQASEEFFSAIERGESPSISDYGRRYPSIAELITKTFSALALLGSDSRSSWAADSNSSHPEKLGEFKIIREIGRGGMGIVYEAEQQSMGRRVAIKILPFAAMLDPTRLTRFKNEIRAAGTLNHQHIVSIHSVGEDQGIHYYAMQLIYGQSIAYVVDQLKATNIEIGPQSIAEAVSQSKTQEQKTTLEKDVDQAEVFGEKSYINSPSTSESQKTSRTSGRKSREFYQVVAQIGEQSALALEHAHQRGVIHRDIKPANLLIDSYGVVFITDFGLARIEADAGLTLTGDLLGTLRYMAPEQLSGSPSDVTHRADIYSLGMTLYELLTLQPAYSQEDRGKLVEQILRSEPAALRKLAPMIPTDLETIVTKAIEREPSDRYRTAQEFAEDLRRFRENKSIRAKPPTILDRAVKWSRRHSDLAWTSAAFLVLFLIGFAIAAGSIFNLYQESEFQRERADSQLKETRLAQQESETHRYELQKELYSLDMQVAFNAWEDGRIDIAEPLLAKHVPADGRPDVRSFGWYALKEYTSRPKPMVISGHEGPVREVAVHPDGLRLVSAGDDGTIRTWNSSTGELLSTINVSDKSLNALAISPNGERFVTGNRSLQLWDLSNASKVKDLASFDSTIEEVAFSPDGQFIASGSRDSVIRIINLVSYETVTLNVKSGNESLQFTERGMVLTAVCKEDQGRVLRSWNCRTGDIIHELSNPNNGDAAFLAASSQGERMVIAGTGQSHLSFWDLNQNRRVFMSSAFNSNIQDMTLSPDDSMLVAASDGGKIRYWDLDSEWKSESPKRVMINKGLVFPGHSGDVTSIIFLDNDRVVSCGEDGLIKIWKDHQSRRITKHLHRSKGNLSAISPDTKKLLTHTVEGQLELLDEVSHKIEWLVASPRDSIKILEFASDGKHFVTADDENIVDVWKIGQEKPLLSFQHTNRLLKAALAPNGQLVSVTGRDGETSVRNVTSAEKVFEVKIDGWGRAIKFSPNGKLLALGGGVPEIFVYDTDTWETVHRLPSSSDTRLIEFSSDGEIIASRQADNFARIWNTTSGALMATLDTSELGFVHSIAFHPDGQCLAMSSYKDTVRLWHLPTQRELGIGMKLLDSNLKYAYKLAFSPDGRKLLALVKKHRKDRYKSRYLDVLETNYQWSERYIPKFSESIE